MRTRDGHVIELQVSTIYKFKYYRAPDHVKKYCKIGRGMSIGVLLVYKMYYSRRNSEIRTAGSSAGRIRYAVVGIIRYRLWI